MLPEEMGYRAVLVDIEVQHFLHTHINHSKERSVCVCGGGGEGEGGGSMKTIVFIAHFFAESVIDKVTLEVFLALKLFDWDGELGRRRHTHTHTV